MFKLRCLLFCIAIIPSLVLGQGKSLYKNYSPKDYDGHAQNWCVIQDNNGLIYIGNTIGLLVYDSKSWKSIKLNNSIVRSLAKDENDVIYYGAQGEFGYLFADSKGNLTNKSLVDLLPDSLKLFGDVWKTYCFKNKVIFQTFDYVFIFENNKIKVIEAENYYHFGYQQDEDFYIIDREIGLKKLINGELLLIKGGEYFANLRIYGWLNDKENGCLLVTREKGLFKVKFDQQSIVEVTPLKTAIDDALIEGEVYCSATLSNQQIGLGTLNKGFFIINKSGQLIKEINKSQGLKSDIINAAFEDQQHGLWLALDVGISRLEINSRINSINEDEGIEGIVNTITTFNQNLYFGTTKGLFEIKDNHLKRISEINSDVRFIFNTEINGNAVLIILTENGTYKLDQKKKLDKLNNEDGIVLTKSKYHPQNYFLGTNTGLCVMDLSNNKIVNFYENPMPEVRKIVEENDSVIWLGTSHNGVYRIKNALKNKAIITSFDTISGLPHLSYNLPFAVGNKIMFGTYKGIFEFQKSKNKFEQIESFASTAVSDKDQIYQIIEGFNHQVWLFKTNAILHEFILYDTKTKKSSFPLRRLGEFDAYQCIYPETEFITWFGGPDGLFRYDASKPSMDSINFKTKIRGVYGVNDTLFGGFYGLDQNYKRIINQPENFIPEIKYKSNNINFEFAALSFDNEKENVYSYYLEDFDDRWSEWTTESKKSYTNLNEGTYTFHVKSKNVYGKEGQEDTFTFTILPPWYRTAWAYFVYVVGAIVMIYLITQISVRRLKRAKERLEAIVINRTAEVVAEKEEVEKQKKIVEVKNKDITDSINYAQRIQQAILPLPEDFSKVFPESFIYFQPRDIVSGDFYWFYKSKREDKNWVYMAAADCTGHGVPGAFMSMIGNTLLNEILNEKQIYETDQILNQLHIEVRAALKQDTTQNTTNDGMDIALCRIDLDTLELQYAGANRALYLFKNTSNGIEFIDIKPNKFPIGGYQAETIRSFTAHVIQLTKNDTFYIFSDGYADQFGGVSNKKFMVKRLQNELTAMQNLPMNNQKYLVQKLVMDWKGEAEQVDDILMIGVRV
jgi:serine phosphatase RsbU (regulator of sigma subunit)/ligand-binding sensor domain-containing protein